MERRELLKMIAAATGMAFVGGDLWAAGYVSGPGKGKLLFSSADVLLLDEIAETILPKTNTPGAKDTGAGAQMAVQVSDCYNATEQGWFRDGLVKLQQRCQQQYQQPFLALTPAQRLELFQQLDTEAKARNMQLASNDSTNVTAKKKADDKAKAPVTTLDTTPHYFTLLKQLTIFVVFTSKVGATEMLRYSAIPGKYEGALPYQPGDRAWAT